ncbi:MAG: hypothetical protein HWE11_10810 [Gammaproteobacteria bacterium]|nr:hypothetical protein [Gammaproteobacteria bacterium]
MNLSLNSAKLNPRMIGQGLLLALLACPVLTQPAFADQALAQPADQTKNGHSTLQYQLAKPWQKFRRPVNDDLLTAGLTPEQLQSSIAPPATKPRALAYYTNIRALLDTSSAGGFNRLYAHPLKPVPGVEYLATTASEAGRTSAVIAVQIPATFNQQRPCLVVSPSSGSRNVYGAVGVTGFWALSKGCAVSYTDKGTGSGFYFLESSKQLILDGQITQQNPGWVNTEKLPKTPGNWVATRHAHSTTNSQKDWGKFTLIAADLGLRALSDHFGRKFTKQQVWVMAAGISNAGGAVIAATEQDTTGLIDATMAGEPNLSMSAATFSVTSATARQSITLEPTFNSFVRQSLFTPCANWQVIPELPSTLVFKKQAAQACTWLIKAKLITATSIAEAAAKAEQNLTDYGLNPGARGLGPVYTAMGLWDALNATYSSAYARLKLFDDPCGSAFQNSPTTSVNQLNDIQLAKVWALSSGIPPTADIVPSTYFNIQKRWPKFAAYPTNVAQTFCYGAWALGTEPLATEFSAHLSPNLINRLRQGVQEIQFSGNLQSTPTIIVHGQADRLLLVNQTSRPYYWKQQMQQRNNSNLRYYEISHGQHFDALLAYPPYNQTLVPLHGYFEAAMTSLWQHHFEHRALPPSGIVETRTRALKNGQLEPLESDHLPPFSAAKWHFSATAEGLSWHRIEHNSTD